MSRTYATLKRKIEKAAEEGAIMIQEQLDKLVYQKYSSGKITQDEYNSLCFMMETRF